MTTPHEPRNSSSAFEQQLGQLRPVPVSGLEAMLYQAGWQAGRAAAEAETAAEATATTTALDTSKTIETSIIRIRHRHWIGFASGAASGLVAASLLFVAMASSGWWPNPMRPESVLPSEQLAKTSELAAEGNLEAAAVPSASAVNASNQGGRGSAGFNLLDWFGSNAEDLAQAIVARRSTVLTTAPRSGNELDRLLSASARAPAGEAQSMKAPPGDGRPNDEFFRYQPGRGDFRNLRF